MGFGGGERGWETHWWLARMLLLLLLHLGRILWLLIQALASLAGVRLVRAAHATVVVDGMEAAGWGGPRALLLPHARRRAPHRRARALRSISAREPPVLMLLRLEEERHGGLLRSLVVAQRSWDAGRAVLRCRGGRVLATRSRAGARCSIDWTRRTVAGRRGQTGPCSSQ